MAHLSPFVFKNKNWEMDLHNYVERGWSSFARTSCIPQHYVCAVFLAPANVFFAWWWCWQVPLAYVSVSSPGAGCLWTGPFVKREQEAFGELRTVRLLSDMRLV